MIVLRFEAGPAIGAGHAMRCLAVGQVLRDLGAEVALAVDEAALSTVPRLAKAGLTLVGPAPLSCALVLMDGYGFTEADERAWAAKGAAVAVFEDTPGRAHVCDVLIDPAPGRGPGDYRAVAPAARFLLGPAYAPMAASFAEVRPRALARRASPGLLGRVLVSTGLTDFGGIAAQALRALRSFPAIETIDVAVGAAAPSLSVLREAAQADPRVRLHLDTADMATLIAAADLGIGAAGTSSWERCALGLPSVVVVAAANQTANAIALTTAGAALVVGEAADLRPEALAGSIMALDGPQPRADMARAAATLVDAQGADRIARILMEVAAAGR